MVLGACPVCEASKNYDGRRLTPLEAMSGIEMTKATGRLVLMVALLALIVALGAAQLFLPLTGLSLNLEIEEAGLGGALIAGLSAVVGYYFKD